MDNKWISKTLVEMKTNQLSTRRMFLFEKGAHGSTPTPSINIAIWM